MVATITLTSASSDLLGYLENDWLPGFNDPTFGDFYQNFDPMDPAKVYTQWGAGTSTNSAVVLDGSFTYVQGDLTGTVDTLTFGDGLTGSGSTGFGVGTPELSIDLGGASATNTFDFAIYNISVNGSLSATPNGPGLYDYFAEVGTNQIGTSGNDKLYSFAGDDSLTGAAGDDTFVFEDNFANDTITDFGTSTGNDDLLDLTGVSAITDSMDLIFNHSNWTDTTGVLTITDGANDIQLTGYVGSDIFTLVNGGNVVV
ncbi:MAG: hemolysin [Hyphomicrobiales bacterium]|nr:hemolysin [Hyphomicrobiales bacterium]